MLFFLMPFLDLGGKVWNNSLHSEYQPNSHLEKIGFPYPLFSSLWKKLCHLKTSHAVIIVSSESDTTIFMFYPICCLPSSAKTQQHFQITGKENKFLEESCHPIFLAVQNSFLANRTHINIPDASLFWRSCLPALSFTIQINTLDSQTEKEHQYQQDDSASAWHSRSGSYLEKLVSGANSGNEQNSPFHLIYPLWLFYF